ncbi:MAG: metallophosphoesterase [Planctomycetota bacterium]
MRRERLEDRPRVPLPHGLLSGKRFLIRRYVAFASAWLNQVLDLLPPGRWLHRGLRRKLEWTEIEIPLRTGGPGLDGTRLLFLSDLHAGSYLNEQDLDRLFAEAAAREPDLVCLGGDLINTRERELLMFRRPLTRLAPPLGIFAVPGNHDHFWGGDIGLWTGFLKDHGVEVLINRGKRVERGGDSLWIAGVDDLTEGEPDLAAALTGVADDEPVLLLSHHPDFFFEACAVDIDLTLSGHTHGGQIKLLGWAAIKHSSFGWHEGLFEREGSKLYVGRGVGVTVLPLRIAAPAEIPILTLRCTGLRPC